MIWFDDWMCWMWLCGWEVYWVCGELSWFDCGKVGKWKFYFCFKWIELNEWWDESIREYDESIWEYDESWEDMMVGMW